MSTVCFDTGMKAESACRVSVGLVEGAATFHRPSKAPSSFPPSRPDGDLAGCFHIVLLARGSSAGPVSARIVGRVGQRYPIRCEASSG